MNSSGLEHARALLAEAGPVVALTGAGVSAESGVPTFRGEGGLWRSYRAEELATPEAFQADPLLVWEWYQMRRDLVSECAPNPGHEALARACVERDDLTLVTQNVDGLHQRALDELGVAYSDDARPLEVHGSLFEIRCSLCTYRRPDRAPVDVRGFDALPRCPECSALLRPAVVWFGEALEEHVIQRAFDLARESRVFLSIGTSAVVYPVAAIPHATLEGGGVIIEVNPDETPLSGAADVCLRGPSGEILPALFSA